MRGVKNLILLAEEIIIGNSKYVCAYLKNGEKLKQQGELQGYTDTTFAVNRSGQTYVYDVNNREIFKHPKENQNTKDDLEVILEVNTANR